MWYEKAAEQKVPEAVCNLGWLAHDKGDLRRALQMFEDSFRLGLPNGARTISWSYVDGWNPEGKSIPKAKLWLDKAVEMGDIEAKYLMAELLREHPSSPFDLLRAWQLYGECSRSEERSRTGGERLAGMRTVALQALGMVAALTLGSGLVLKKLKGW